MNIQAATLLNNVVQTNGPTAAAHTNGIQTQNVIQNQSAPINKEELVLNLNSQFQITSVTSKPQMVQQILSSAQQTPVQSQATKESSRFKIIKTDSERKQTADQNASSTQFELLNGANYLETNNLLSNLMNGNLINKYQRGRWIVSDFEIPTNHVQQAEFNLNNNPLTFSVETNNLNNIQLLNGNANPLKTNPNSTAATLTNNFNPVNSTTNGKFEPESNLVLSQQIPNGTLQKIVTITKNESEDHSANNLNGFSTIQQQQQQQHQLATNGLVNTLPPTVQPITTTTAPTTHLIQSNYAPNFVEIQQKVTTQQMNNSNQLDELNKNENSANIKENEIETASSLANELTKTTNSLANSSLPSFPSSTSSNVAHPTTTAAVLNNANVINTTNSIQLNNNNSNSNLATSLQSQQQTQATQPLNVSQANYQALPTVQTSLPQIVQLTTASNSNTNLNANQVSPKELKTNILSSAPIPASTNLNDHEHNSSNMQKKILNPTSNAINDIISTVDVEISNSPDFKGSESGIHSRIELAMDLVKSHLTSAVKEEIVALKNKIKTLNELCARLEQENQILKQHATPDTLKLLENRGLITPSPSNYIQQSTVPTIAATASTSASTSILNNSQEANLLSQIPINLNAANLSSNTLNSNLNENTSNEIVRNLTSASSLLQTQPQSSQIQNEKLIETNGEPVIINLNAQSE